MLAASAVTVGVTSCDRDTAINPADDGGEPTTVGIVFQVPSAGQPAAPDGQTRATNDGNAKEEEAAIKSADVFIYSGNGDYLSHMPLTSADFSTTNTGTATSGTITGWDEYASTKPIATTTGQKYFLVGVNLPAGAATALQGKSMGTAATQALTVTRANINLTNGLPMFNQSGPTAATIATGATPQEVKVRVERIVSKITVERRMSPVMDQFGTPGTIGQLTWAVNNTNTRYFLPHLRRPQLDGEPVRLNRIRAGAGCRLCER